MDPALAQVLLAMVEQYQWSDVSEDSYGAEYHRCPLCVASENYRPQPHGPLWALLRIGPLIRIAGGLIRIACAGARLKIARPPNLHSAPEHFPSLGVSPP